MGVNNTQLTNTVRILRTKMRVLKLKGNNLLMHDESRLGLEFEIWEKTNKLGKSTKDLVIHIGESTSTLNESSRRDFDFSEIRAKILSNFNIFFIISKYFIQY